MSRKFSQSLSLVLGTALSAGVPAFAYSSATEAIIQSPAAQTGAPAASTLDLADRVEQLWSANKELADADVEARVDGDVLVLEGEVRNPTLRQTAERLARRVKGVTSIDNRIAVRLSAAPSTEGEGTRGTVAAGDAQDAARTAGDRTEDAAAATGSAIGKAAGATKDAIVTGARKTADAVEATPAKIDETWITTKIASKINADDALEDVDVDVKVRKNVVTISGMVPTVEQRDRVLRIARQTEGVERVIDQMTVRAAGGQ